MDKAHAFQPHSSHGSPDLIEAELTGWKETVKGSGKSAETFTLFPLHLPGRSRLKVSEL